jgi:hypothetical protein
MDVRYIAFLLFSDTLLLSQDLSALENMNCIYLFESHSDSTTLAAMKLTSIFFSGFVARLSAPLLLIESPASSPALHVFGIRFG